MNGLKILLGFSVLLFEVTTLFGGKAPPKPDMILVLEDKREVILHPDSTWEFKEFSFIQEDFDDIYMDLDDGRIICLKNDYKWCFVKKKPPKTKLDFKELPEVNATGTMTHKNLDHAVEGAKKQAFERAATRLLSYAKKSKMTHQYLVACIKNEIGDAGAEVSYKPGWTATAKINLTKYQVNKILDCVAVQVDSATASTTPTATSEGTK